MECSLFEWIIYLWFSKLDDFLVKIVHLKRKKNEKYCFLNDFPYLRYFCKSFYLKSIFQTMKIQKIVFNSVLLRDSLGQFMHNPCLKGVMY